jgi:hypothetical protein
MLKLMDKLKITMMSKTYMPTSIFLKRRWKTDVVLAGPSGPFCLWADLKLEIATFAGGCFWGIEDA